MRLEGAQAHFYGDLWGDGLGGQEEFNSTWQNENPSLYGFVAAARQWAEIGRTTGATWQCVTRDDR